MVEYSTDGTLELIEQVEKCEKGIIVAKPQSR